MIAACSCVTVQDLYYRCSDFIIMPALIIQNCMLILKFVRHLDVINKTKGGSQLQCGHRIDSKKPITHLFISAWVSTLDEVQEHKVLILHETRGEEGVR